MRIENGVSNNYNAAASTTIEVSSADVNQRMISKVGNEKQQDVGADSIINDDLLDSAIEVANRNLNQYNKVIERSVHEKTHTIMYVLKDTLTNEVIKEFPPRKIQDMIAKMWEIAGILVDERR